MRVAILADLHIHERGPRWAECTRILDWIVEDLRARNVDAILVAGDVYEARSTPGERLYAAEWFTYLSRIAPVVVVAGNHDAPGDVELLGYFGSDRNAVIAEERPAVHTITTRSGALVVAGLPWPRKAALLAAGGATADAPALLRAVISGLDGAITSEAPSKAPVVFLGHVMMGGSETSTGQPLVGQDFELTLADLAHVDADLYALGHIHKAQDWTIGDAPVVYPGSPYATAFGELESKGYVLATWDGERFAVEQVTTPRTPMVLLEDEWTEDDEEDQQGRHRGTIAGWMVGTYPPVSGAEVRFRYCVDAEHRVAAARAATQMREVLLAAGAVRVEVDVDVRRTVRARAPQITEAATLGDKVAVWLAARGGAALEAERRERVLAKVARVDSEAATSG